MIDPDKSADIDSKRDGTQVPSSAVFDRSERTLGERITALLNASDLPLSLSIISKRLGAKPKSISRQLSRLRMKGITENSGDGWFLIRKLAESSPEALDIFEEYDEEHPLLFHDIHLVYVQEELLINNRETANREDPSLKCRLNTYTQSIFDSTFNEVPFNPLNPKTFYQQWNAPKERLKEITGGYQEAFDDYGTKIQLFGTGTIKIILGASESPCTVFDVLLWLGQVDAIFLSRTGLRFDAISDLFKFEMLHVHTDKEWSFEGTSKLNITVQTFKNCLVRNYQKEIDGKQVLRDEICLTNGSYAENGFNQMLTLMRGSVNNRVQSASIFKLAHQNERYGKDIVALYRLVLKHIENDRKGGPP